jgi:hypothetical protein
VRAAAVVPCKARGGWTMDQTPTSLRVRCSSAVDITVGETGSNATGESGGGGGGRRAECGERRARRPARVPPPTRVLVGRRRWT